MLTSWCQRSGEYKYLASQLSDMGYKRATGPGWKREGDVFHFDLFQGNRIHTTGLLESPLTEGHNRPMIELSHLYVGILNDYDLISSKLMRGTQVDFNDCVMLAKAHKDELDLDKLIVHYNEMVSYDAGEKRLRPNIDHFLELLREVDQNDK